MEFKNSMIQYTHKQYHAIRLHLEGALPNDGDGVVEKSERHRDHREEDTVQGEKRRQVCKLLRQDFSQPPVER